MGTIAIFVACPGLDLGGTGRSFHAYPRPLTLVCLWPQVAAIDKTETRFISAVDILPLNLRQAIRPWCISVSCVKVVVRTIDVLNLRLAYVDAIVHSCKIHHEQVYSLAGIFVIPFHPHMSATVLTPIPLRRFDPGSISTERRVVFCGRTQKLEVGWPSGDMKVGRPEFLAERAVATVGDELRVGFHIQGVLYQSLGRLT